jgi:rubrerythrin
LSDTYHAERTDILAESRTYTGVTHTLICIDCGAEYRGTPNDCPHCGE